MHPDAIVAIASDPYERCQMLACGQVDDCIVLDEPRDYIFPILYRYIEQVGKTPNVYRVGGNLEHEPLRERELFPGMEQVPRGFEHDHRFVSDQVFFREVVIVAVQEVANREAAARLDKQGHICGPYSVYRIARVCP